MDARKLKEIKRGYPLKSRIKLLETELVIYGKVVGHCDNGSLQIEFDADDTRIMEVPAKDVIRVTPAEYKKHQEDLKAAALAQAKLMERMEMAEPIEIKLLDTYMSVAEVIEAAEYGTQFEVSPSQVSEVPTSVDNSVACRIQCDTPNEATAPRVICDPIQNAVQAPNVVIVGNDSKNDTLASKIRAALLSGKPRATVAKEFGTSYQYVYAIDKKLPRK